MKYGKITGIEKNLSRMVFGTATPLLFAAMAQNADAEDKEKAFALLYMVYENGVTAFDCASHYGEPVLGEWMEKRGIRENCVVITKGAHPNQWRHRVTAFDILSDVHDSLKKLRTDYIDIYMLHRDNKDVPVSEIVDVLNDLAKEGKIRVFGGSNWTHERIEEANQYAEQNGLQKFTVSSPNFGLAEQVADPWLSDAHFGDGCVTISGPENKEARLWYAEHQIPVLAYSSMARGFFSGSFKSTDREMADKLLDEPGRIGYWCDNNFERLSRCEILAEKKGASVAQIAMAWIFQQDFDVYALSCPSNEEQMRQNVRAQDILLTEWERKWLNLEA